jgi:quercetin dioxygenase-like cupin family protein
MHFVKRRGLFLQFLTTEPVGKSADVTIRLQSGNGWVVDWLELFTIRRHIRDGDATLAPSTGATLSIGMARVLDNPRSGERIVILHSGADTDGQLFEFDVFLQPGAHVPAGHAHPRQGEQFTVVAGQVRFRVAGRDLVVGPGSRLSVPAGTSHWFGNVGSSMAHLRVEVRPALRMQELFETSVRCSGSSSAWWARVLDWALIPLDFQRELAVPNVPAWVVRTLLSPLAWLRLRLSVDPNPSR